MDCDAAAPDGRLMALLRWALVCCRRPPKSGDQKTPGMELRQGADCNHA
jgi:hypothetical protein